MRSVLLLLVCTVALFTNADSSQIGKLETDAMHEFYSAAGGHKWTQSDGWLKTERVCYNATTNWFGVTCNEYGMISEIILNDNNLQGYLVNSIGLLNHLEILDLSLNQLTSTIPSLELLENLKILKLQNNQLSGTLPVFSSLVNLEDIHLEFNLLSGPFPRIVELRKLHTIIVDTNQFNSSLPDLPSSIEVIDFANNKFSGTIPSSYLTLLEATTLDVANNNLFGPLPPLDIYPNLFYLNCSHNQFNGSVIFHSNFSELHEIDISYNQLSGSLPYGFATAPLINLINASHNMFSGPLPRFSFEHTPTLSELDFSHNDLIGGIPQSIGDLLFLSSLYLQTNRLNGTLPAFLKMQPSSLSIDLTNNQFKCPLPLWCSADEGNGLCAPCYDQQPTPSPSPSISIIHHYIEQQHDIDWQFVSSVTMPLLGTILVIVLIIISTVVFFTMKFYQKKQQLNNNRTVNKPIL